jgi:hypothetical protein
MNVSVKQNPFLERDFGGTMQNSAYDLQSCARRDDLQNITDNFLDLWAFKPVIIVRAEK